MIEKTEFSFFHEEQKDKAFVQKNASSIIASRTRIAQTIALYLSFCYMVNINLIIRNKFYLFLYIFSKSIIITYNDTA